MKNYKEDTEINRREFLKYLAGTIAATTVLNSCISNNYQTIDENPPIILNDIEPNYGSNLEETVKNESIQESRDRLKIKNNYKSNEDSLLEKKGSRNRGLSVNNSYENIEEKINLNEKQLNQKLNLKYQFNQTEYENPGSISIGQESDVLLLAKTLYCEGREFYRLESKPNKPTALELVADSVIQRSSRKGKTVKDVILQPNQYSFLNKNSSGYRKFVNPLYNAKQHPTERVAWEKCYMVALERLNQGPLSDNLGVTHFHDDSVNPTWAIGIKPRHVAKSPLSKMFFYFLPKELS
ncbi:MAG TPA: cell wall hydrolase [Candidatus Paceibacterota bacterium]|nr:cell wall hydrolase [Candidatus Paceibacterota bacterium]